MKNHRMIAVILLLCMLASLTACMPSNLNQTEPENPTTTVPTTTVSPTTIATLPLDLDLLSYDTNIDTSVINIDSFVQLYQHAEYILQNCNTVRVAKSYKYSHLLFELRKHLDCSRVIDSAYYIYINELTEDDYALARTFIAMALLTAAYEDYCCYVFHDYWESPPMFTNSGPASVSIIVSTDYKDFGFQTIEEYSDALRINLDRGPHPYDIVGNETFIIEEHVSWVPEGGVYIGAYKEYFAALEESRSIYGFNDPIYYIENSNSLNKILAKASPEA